MGPPIGVMSTSTRYRTPESAASQGLVVRRSVIPLRVSVIGLDGAGKSSTTLRAIDTLSARFTVMKPGREPFVIGSGGRHHCLPAASRWVESTFKRADATRRRGIIGATRLAFIRYQGWLEPHLVTRFRPQLVLGTRCMIIDPAIYSEIYAPSLARLSLERRLRLFRRYSGLPFRDLYVVLRTPADVAMARIQARLAKLPAATPPAREHWLHLHEQEPILRELASRFDDALTTARRLSPFELVQVDTTRHDESSVAALIAAEVQRVCAARGIRPRAPGEEQ